MLMTCRNVRQLHDAFVDGGLSASLTAEVHAHLLQCPECQHEIEMLRACTDVITQDKSEPMLDSGFASRVIAQLPKPVTVVADTPDEIVSHGRSSVLFRIFAKGTLPAAAAALFLAVLIWPTADQQDQPGKVLGTAVAMDESGATSVVMPTLDVITDTRAAARNINQLLKVSVDRAGREVSEDLARSGQPLPGDNVSLVDVLLQPFNGMLMPEDEPHTADESEIVRF